MSGNVRFEGEEEAKQTDALAERIVDQVGTTNSFVGKRITAMSISGKDVHIEVEGGASLDFKVEVSNVNSRFLDQLRVENQLQKHDDALLRGPDPVRAEGEKIMRPPGQNSIADSINTGLRGDE